MSTSRKVRRWQRWIIASCVVATCSFLYYFFWGVWAPLSRASAIFGGISAAAQMAALLLAVLAAAFAYPTYAEWRRVETARAVLVLGVEVVLAEDDPPTPVPPNGRVAVPSLVIVNVSIRNTGNAPARDAVLNLWVPSECTLDALDGRTSVPEVLAHNDQLIPGLVVPVRRAVLERSFVPGPVYTCQVQVGLPRSGEYPVMVIVGGDEKTVAEPLRACLVHDPD